MTHRWSLRTRFVLFALACLIPLAIVAWFFLDRSLDRSTEQIIRNEETVLDVVNRSLTSYFTSAENVLNRLGQQDPIELVLLDPNETTITNATSLLGQTRLASSEFSGLLLITDDLNVVSQSGIEIQLTGANGLEAQVQQTVQNGQVMISSLITLDDGTRVIMISVPITVGVEGQEDTSNTSTTTEQGTEGGATTDEQAASPGENIGAIAAIIQTSSLEQRALPFTTGSTEIAVTDGVSVIIGTAGIVNESSDFLSRRAILITAALSGTTGNQQLDNAAGQERVLVYGPVQKEQIPWAIIISSPAPRTFSSTLYQQGAAILAIAALGILTLAVIFGEITAKPLRALAHKAESLQRGDFSTNLAPMGSGEIRVLSEAFADMANQLQAQFGGLEESRKERERQTVQMRDLLRRTLRLQEDERRRIASEIHDAVSPLITGALYQSRALQMTNGKTPELEREQSLMNVSNLLERASDELHDVIFDLRPPDLDDIGVVAAIEAFAQTINQTGLNCRIEVDYDPTELSPEVRLGIYRIVQEALHNVVRHANADEAVVRLERVGEFARVTVRDNGSGFDPEQAVRPTSLGMLSMKERADAIGAQFRIVSRAGGGTAIIIERIALGNVMQDDVLETLMSEIPYGSEAGDL